MEKMSEKDFLKLLYAYVKKNKKALLRGEKILTLNPGCLSFLSYWLEENPEAIRARSLETAIHVVANVISTLQALRINDASEGHGIHELDLGLFASLNTLELVRFGPQQINGFLEISYKLTKFSIIKGIGDLVDLVNIPVRELAAESRSAVEYTGDIYRGRTANEILEIRGKKPWMHLEELMVSECNITEFPEPCAEWLTKVTYINLSRNNLSQLEHFEKCPHLQKLNVSHNRIESLKDVHLSLGNVTVLILSYNYIKAIGDINKVYSLEVLDLSHNDLYSFPDVAGIQDLPLLFSFSISGSPVAKGKQFYLSFLALISTREPTRLFQSSNARFVMDGKWPLSKWNVKCKKMLDRKEVSDLVRRYGVADGSNNRKRRGFSTIRAEDEISIGDSYSHNTDAALPNEEEEEFVDPGASEVNPLASSSTNSSSSANSSSFTSPGKDRPEKVKSAANLLVGKRKQRVAAIDGSTDGLEEIPKERGRRVMQDIAEDLKKSAGDKYLLSFAEFEKTREIPGSANEGKDNFSNLSKAVQEEENARPIVEECQSTADGCTFMKISVPSGGDAAPTEIVLKEESEPKARKATLIVEDEKAENELHNNKAEGDASKKESDSIRTTDVNNGSVSSTGSDRRGRYGKEKAPRVEGFSKSVTLSVLLESDSFSFSQEAVESERKAIATKAARADELRSELSALSTVGRASQTPETLPITSLSSEELEVEVLPQGEDANAGNDEAKEATTPRLLNIHIDSSAVGAEEGRSNESDIYPNSEDTQEEIDRRSNGSDEDGTVERDDDIIADELELDGGNENVDVKSSDDSATVEGSEEEEGEEIHYFGTIERGSPSEGQTSSEEEVEEGESINYFGSSLKKEETKKDTKKDTKMFRQVEIDSRYDGVTTSTGKEKIFHEGEAPTGILGGVIPRMDYGHAEAATTKAVRDRYAELSDEEEITEEDLEHDEDVTQIHKYLVEVNDGDGKAGYDQRFVILGYPKRIVEIDAVEMKTIRKRELRNLREVKRTADLVICGHFVTGLGTVKRILYQLENVSETLELLELLNRILQARVQPEIRKEVREEEKEEIRKKRRKAKDKPFFRKYDADREREKPQSKGFASPAGPTGVVRRKGDSAQRAHQGIAEALRFLEFDGETNGQYDDVLFHIFSKKEERTMSKSDMQTLHKLFKLKGSDRLLMLLRCYFIVTGERGDEERLGYLAISGKKFSVFDVVVRDESQVVDIPELRLVASYSTSNNKKGFIIIVGCKALAMRLAPLSSGKSVVLLIRNVEIAGELVENLAKSMAGQRFGAGVVLPIVDVTDKFKDHAAKALDDYAITHHDLYPVSNEEKVVRDVLLCFQKAEALQSTGIDGKNAVEGEEKYFTRLSALVRELGDMIPRTLVCTSKYLLLCAENHTATLTSMVSDGLSGLRVVNAQPIENLDRVVYSSLDTWRLSLYFGENVEEEILWELVMPSVPERDRMFGVLMMLYREALMVELTYVDTEEEESDDDTQDDSFLIAK